MATTAERARGRWGEIIPALGFPKDVVNGKHQPCPHCKGKDRFRFTDLNGDGTYFCSGCGPGNGFQLLMKTNGWDFATAAAKVDSVIGKCKLGPMRNSIDLPDRRFLRRLWGESAAMGQNAPAAIYLAKRGIRRISPVLRHVAKMQHRNSGRSYPGFIAPFSGPDGKVVTLHRTWVTEQGEKAPVEPCRAFVPGRLVKGGAIRLFPVAERLGIAEGIETALSAAQLFDLPVWACTSENVLRQWEPPTEVSTIVVFGDSDENFVGQAAAYELAKRLVLTKKLSVEIRLPNRIGDDWNDVLMEDGDG